MTRHSPKLGSASDWMKEVFSQSDQHYPDLGSDASLSIEFLRSFLRRHFAGKAVVASRNVGCFLSLDLS